ncbi:MAG: transcription-repair coupling factor [Flavobacteriaceae bacterium]|nr:transcription-repair coupling factor [Flavobacteriaceae bacterium]
MKMEELLNRFESHPVLAQVLASVNTNTPADIVLKGLTASAFSLHVAAFFRQSHKPILLILNNKETAAYYLNDLEQFLGEKNVFFYPSSYRRPYEIEETDNASVLLRAEVISRLHRRKKPALMVTYPEALFEKVVTRKTLSENTLSLAVGDKLSLDFVNEILFEYKFKRVDFVSEPGEFSVRGGIIDVFSFSHIEPYRIEFFGDEVESIRTFNIVDQLSFKTLKKIQIVPNVENKVLLENRDSFLNHLHEQTAVFIENSEVLQKDLDILFEKALSSFEKLSGEVNHATPDALFNKGEEAIAALAKFHRFSLNSVPKSSQKTVVFETQPQPAFNKQFDRLAEYLTEKQANGYTLLLCCANEQQVKRLHDIFADIAPDLIYHALELPLYGGFVDTDLKWVCFTDHQFFERYHRFRLKDGYAKKEALSLSELNTLQVGDYVTHIDHGIGRFGGLQKIEVEGKKQEAIKLIYGENDILYLSIHALHKISKYNSKDGKAPKIYKLGSGAWKALKEKTKTRVKKLAFDLIQLYAKRKMQKGFAFAPDSYLQHELEASFIYEDTPDQEKATREVKADMESDLSMDRLICGDVGFGKTEIAIRAAFKAVDNSKQVAVLVPTTILAFQHFKTFSERLKDLPVSVDYLNRFRSAKARKEVLEKLENGQLDIVIGTHQLVNKSIHFKDLGLLIVDEEQKFGVSVKDKLKTLRANIDTLTLTATPIPRTLQFSLMAARDLSVMTTPPPNRYPIETQVVRFSEELIRDAIAYELQRGGQVFFVNNRIENIKEVAGLIQRLVPDAKIGIGHGQMDGKKLEALMLDFMNGAFDVLISTSIIESGLDVPNANTMIVNNANHFGLSDLHQIRGRVGRSNKKAFCYFITPPYHQMTEDARKRITALEQHTDLGSGIHIAMKDLEIRGAGDLLGAEQSGFINEMGFETYQKILQEAVDELKENEFKELYAQDGDEPKPFVKDVQIDTDIELLFPDAYINSISERLKLYQELAEIKTEEALTVFEQKVTDRFGDLPEPSRQLLNSVRLKWWAADLGIEKLVLKQQTLIGYFIADQQAAFYQSDRFLHVIRTVQQQPAAFTIKEKQTRNGLRLLLNVKNVKNIDAAIDKIQTLL